MENNGNGKKREETAARIIKALHESNGLLTEAAALSGIGYRTINRYVAEYPSVKEAAQEAKERMLDFAESKLYSKIKDGDNTCIIFYLKTQGKSRGYIEREELTGADGVPVGPEPDIKELSDDALLRIINKGQGGTGDAKKTKGKT